jgi:hypothetical protein
LLSKKAPVNGAFCATCDMYLDGFKVVYYIITQKDIRQVQLEKGTVRTGIEFLMGSLDVDSSSVVRFLIAASSGIT